MVYGKMNHAAKAREHLEKALQLNPKFPQADEARRALAGL
jgi:Tfp pilus assembly protein PilF